jgi:PAS domain S-box-containing protein
MPDPLHVLITDDNLDDRDLLRRELAAEFGTLALQEVVDAEGLQAALRAERCDLAITDYNLPWTDGLDVLRQVKRRWPDCPVLMLTGTANEEIAVTAMKAGVDEYVVKAPHHLSRLREIFRAVLARAEQHRRQHAAEELIQLQATALQAAANAIVITDRAGTIEWVNVAFARLTGYTAPEVLGRNPRLLKSGQHSPEFYRQVWDTILAGHTWRGEFINKRKDGSLYTEEQIITPVRNRRGDIVHFIGIKQDISQRKAAEEALQEHLRLTELTAEVSVTLIQDQPLAAMLRRCTEALVRHLRATFARVWTLNPKTPVLELQAGSGQHSQFDVAYHRLRLGQTAIGRIAQTRQPLFTNTALDDSLLRDQDWARRESLTAFAGLPLVVADSLVGVLALFSERPLSPVVLGALGPVADQIALGIERKRGEEALRLSEQRYRYLIETAPEVIGTVSPEGLIGGVNPAFERTFGWPGADWVGRPFRTLVAPEDLPHATETLFRVLRGETPPPLAVRCLTSRGELIDVEVLSTPQVHEGRLTGALVVIRDVTARKRLEAQYLQAQKMEAVGRLAGGVAHDFNNLLTIINGYAELLMATTGRDAKAHGLLEEIRKAGERAAGLTQRLLAFSRKQAVYPRLLDLNLVITDLAKMLQRLIGEDVRLVTNLHQPLRPIKADPTHIESIIVNLAVNARDAMPEGGTLTLGTDNRDLDREALQGNPDARPGPFVTLAVTDTGSGISPEVLPDIFKPFFTTKAPGKGTGLGLATVHDIVHQSGGVVEVVSAVGRGTTFRIYFPQPEDGALAVPARPSSLELRQRGTETILLVEDDEGVRALARLVLQSRGYSVIEARSGDEAVRLCARHSEPIHLVVTDLVMPNLSGRQLILQLQQARPGVKILCMSGYLDDALAQHGIVESGLPFLQKPFSPDTLASKVREVLDNR